MINKPVEDCPRCGSARYRTPTSGKARCNTCILSSATKNRDKINERNRNSYYENKRLGRIRIKPPDYAVWIGMKQRCFNKNYRNYAAYGGRGITVCDRWKNSFELFIQDMGPRPEPKHLYSLDRYPDKNGNYEPGNCRWATFVEQHNNQRTNRSNKQSMSEHETLEYKGSLITLKQFSDLTDIHLEAVKYRYAQHPKNTSWILYAAFDNRIYLYENRLYNLSELSYISGKHYTTIGSRIKHLGWSVKDAVESSVNRKVPFSGIYR